MVCDSAKNAKDTFNYLVMLIAEGKKFLHKLKIKEIINVFILNYHLSEILFNDVRNQGKLSMLEIIHLNVWSAKSSIDKLNNCEIKLSGIQTHLIINILKSLIVKNYLWTFNLKFMLKGCNLSELKA